MSPIRYPVKSNPYSRRDKPGSVTKINFHIPYIQSERGWIERPHTDHFYRFTSDENLLSNIVKQQQHFTWKPFASRKLISREHEFRRQYIAFFY